VAGGCAPGGFCPAGAAGAAEDGAGAAWFEPAAGAGEDGAGAPGVGGAASGTWSSTDPPRRDPTIASVSEVSMKMTAHTVVAFDSTVAAPRLPRAV
jgi:hypothetical protein